MKNPEKCFEYLKQYPNDAYALQAFRSIDKKRLNELQKKSYEDCDEFVKTHSTNAICLTGYARHPFFPPNNESLRCHMRRMKVRSSNGKLFLSLYDEREQDIRRELLDFVILRTHELRVGLKHFWLADKATFVYGAGRLIVSSLGEVEYLDNHSGHYRPNAKDFERMKACLESIFTVKHYHFMHHGSA